METMKNRKLFILFGLLLILSLLYLNKHFQDSNLNVKHVSNLRGTKVKIPTVTGHHITRFLSVTNKECVHQFELQNISITTINSKNKWQKTLNSSNLFLYSAFSDNRLETKYLRIIAMSKGSFRQSILCQIWYSNHNSTTVEANIQEMWISSWDSAEDDQYYRPLLLSCFSSNTSIPIAVSILGNVCQEPDNLLWLNSSKHTRFTRKNFAICLKPLLFEQDITMRLVEWLELQLILGADTITVYEHHFHPHTLTLLETYVKAGWVNIQSYALPDTNEKDPKKLRTLLYQDVWQKRRHEILAYNDCFYRHIESHKYVINLDLDEALVPLEHDSWKELLDYAFTKNPMLSQSASISAANVYFFNDFEENNLHPNHFHMLTHLYRSANFTPPGFAQKSFFSTNYTEIVSNHYALKSIYPNVRMTTAIERYLIHLHHYRTSCPPKMEKECEENYMKFRVLDPVILKFKERLIRNAGIKLKELNFSEII